MKNLLIIAFLIASGSIWAQEFNEKIAVPLSSPDKRGKLEVGQVRGNIVITAYNGKEVIIQATSGKDDCDGCDHDHGDKKSSAPSGMKRIASSPLELEASENNNKVEIETNSWKKPINLDIKIPANFDLEVSTVHGTIEVTGISGTHEISSVNGKLTLKDMSGSIVSNTVNGTILVNFKSVKQNEPMSFVTLNGNVDVTFPTNIKARAKMRSDRGEIFTDFDMSVDQSKPEVKSNDGEYKVSINSWVYGDINGGGPEYTFKNMNGDIIIRKQ
ncbi:DUF4097 family beta strand repeat-containing protein [Ekhidna sp. To15]|uniref:DUF4097 family beta strand repeat-containing protein n=1 Tax=Ekhidna sp. To15 TaxID=3395267 RepID=UPI003F52871B